MELFIGASWVSSCTAQAAEKGSILANSPWQPGEQCKESVSCFACSRLYRLFPSVVGAAAIFKPETLVRWHRSGFRLYWRWKSRRGVGRPAVPADIRDLIRAISRDNPLWGAPRIHGELLKLRIDIAQSTVVKYMPGRRGPPSPGWRAFLSNHSAQIAAIDLFVVPTFGFKVHTGWSFFVWTGDASSGPM